ncbi:Hypothetical_protein [Hexamita inflata]|uniref:Hypothetical_protein n=1 Tax=Hexamita inflata TaxID=28002 RepID=A0AA86V4Q5_9EUKA|nr:Hypothetical protein HINF_LOCUS44373 [Hexamita inflata]
MKKLNQDAQCREMGNFIYKLYLDNQFDETINFASGLRSEVDYKANKIYQQNVIAWNYNFCLHLFDAFKYCLQLLITGNCMISILIRAIYLRVFQWLSFSNCIKLTLLLTYYVRQIQGTQNERRICIPKLSNTKSFFRLYSKQQLQIIHVIIAALNEYNIIFLVLS